jgi:hypothetical protein
VSQRRACHVVGQHRSTQRLPRRQASSEEQKLRRRLRGIARQHPRWGWRMAHRLLRRDGQPVNHCDDDGGGCGEGLTQSTTGLVPIA